MSSDSESPHPVALPKFGLGGVALGNEFEPVTDEAACRTLEAAWEAGVRYFDTSPWYGLGLCERRFGAVLHRKDRDSYWLSLSQMRAEGTIRRWGVGVNAPTPG